MIHCGIKIQGALDEQWIRAVSSTQRLKGLEIGAELLADHHLVERLYEAGLSCLAVRDIIAPENASFIACDESEDLFQDIRNTVYDMMLCAETLNVECFTIQLLLDRFSGTASEEEQFVRKNALLLHKLTRAPLESHYSIAVQVRQPRPYPSSREWALARKICETAASERIGLYVHFYPDEWAESHQSLSSFIEECQPYLKALCFHYDTRIGEILYDDEQAEIARRLKLLGYDGVILFAPMVFPETEPSKVCKTAQEWADYYGI